MSITVLAGDIGGTKTMLALYGVNPARELREIRSVEFPSASFPSVDEALRSFLTTDRPDRIGLGVAGPVRDGVCLRANCGWKVDASALAQVFQGSTVRVLNDFHAVALSLPSLRDADVVVLQDGQMDPAGPKAVLGAGTGLGEAVLISRDGQTQVLPSEAGHADFAPRGDLGIALLKYLRVHGRVSVESVVSGPGIAAAFRFVVDRGLAIPAAHVVARMQHEDVSAVVGEEGLEKRCPACAMALSIFVDAYGAEAGNLALRSMPTGGLFIAGGIAARVTPALQDGSFMRAFRDKAPRAALMDEFRVSIVTNRRVGLFGARAAAMEGL